MQITVRGSRQRWRIRGRIKKQLFGSVISSPGTLADFSVTCLQDDLRCFLFRSCHQDAAFQFSQMKAAQIRVFIPIVFPMTLNSQWISTELFYNTFITTYEFFLHHLIVAFCLLLVVFCLSVTLSVSLLNILGAWWTFLSLCRCFYLFVIVSSFSISHRFWSRAPGPGPG